MEALSRGARWPKPSAYSRNGQRLPRRTSNGFDRMEVVALGFRRRWAWRMVCRNLSRFEGKAPQPYANGFERRQKRDHPEANLLRQNNKGLMREEAVTTGLSQGFAPVRQLALERTGARPGNPGKRLGIREALRRKRIPRHDVQIGNPIAVDGDLSSECKRSLAASLMNLFGLPTVCPRERNSETILGGSNPFAARKIMPGLAESQFRHRYQSLTHVDAPARLVSMLMGGSQEPRIPPRRAATFDRRPLPLLRLPNVTIPHHPCRVYRLFRAFFRSG